MGHGTTTLTHSLMILESSSKAHHPRVWHLWILQSVDKECPLSYKHLGRWERPIQRLAPLDPFGSDFPSSISKSVYEELSIALGPDKPLPSLPCARLLFPLTDSRRFLPPPQTQRAGVCAAAASSQPVSCNQVERCAWRPGLTGARGASWGQLLIYMVGGILRLSHEGHRRDPCDAVPSSLPVFGEGCLP